MFCESTVKVRPGGSMKFRSLIGMRVARGVTHAEKFRTTHRGTAFASSPPRKTRLAHDPVHMFLNHKKGLLNNTGNSETCLF